MDNHQKRIITRLSESLESSGWNLETLIGKQQNIEAYLNVVDDSEIQAKLDQSISKIDECVHLMDEAQGVCRGEKFVMNLEIS